MGALETFEQKGLFRLTRFLATLIVVGLIFAFVAGAFIFAGTIVSSDETRVDPDAVLRAVQPPQQHQQEGQSGGGVAPYDPDQLPGIRLPFELQPYFSDPSNRKVLLSRIEDMSKGEKQDYVDNLAEIVKAAKARGVNVTDCINEYFRQKADVMRRAESAKTVKTQMRLYLAGAAVSLLGLVALFSLILVLLAIERNTRIHLRSLELPS